MITTATSADAARADRSNPQWEKLRPIIESLADGIVVVDRAGDIRFANPAAAKLFNRPAKDLIGTPFGSPLVAGETTEMEIVRRGAGEIAYAELRSVNTDWEGEQVELVSLREITDRKHAEERARQLACEREARVEAEAASQAKSDFLAIMSHELRTPLNAILGYSELMELGMSGELTEAMRKQIARIRLSAKHLLGLVNDILDLAKVEAGRLIVEILPSSVTESIASAITLIQPQAHSKNLELSTLPGSEKLPLYVGDSERVRQILVNLLSNAVKCTSPGGKVVVAASVAAPDPGARLLPRKSYICVRVSDTGPGIPEDKLEAIFEPFVQAESGPTRPLEGSGLGLTIGRRLARAMGGDLTVVSEPEKGSTFSLWLPAEDRVAQDSSGTEAGDAPEATQTGSASHILRDPDFIRKLRGLAEVASSVMAQLGPIVDRIVTRIRADSIIETSPSLRTPQVVDHLSTLVADIVGSLAAVEEAAGKPSQMLADAMEIQRLVSERHGAQRARLGWSEPAMRREFMIIREELNYFVGKAVPPAGELSVEVALAALGRFVDQAEFAGVRALEREIDH
ncbi:MAG TPA: ATP-binding protein [Gemmatimonadaceae bacterium]|nr:ATP-binding protein [Gemmatimonadaceae bacterium]